jgi:hypothetical protein
VITDDIAFDGPTFTPLALRPASRSISAVAGQFHPSSRSFSDVGAPNVGDDLIRADLINDRVLDLASGNVMWTL